MDLYHSAHFGTPWLSVYLWLLALGNSNPWAKTTWMVLFPRGNKVILIPRVVLAVQRLPGCQFTAGLERLQL